MLRLTRAVFPQQAGLATIAGYAFALSPPAMFMSSLYTESPFALLTFWGMLQYVRKRYWLAALLWGLASLMRSNAIIYAGFFVFDALVLPIVSRRWTARVNDRHIYKGCSLSLARVLMHAMIRFADTFMQLADDSPLLPHHLVRLCRVPVLRIHPILSR